MEGNLGAPSAHASFFLPDTMLTLEMHSPGKYPWAILHQELAPRYNITVRGHNNNPKFVDNAQDKRPQNDVGS